MIWDVTGAYLNGDRFHFSGDNHAAMMALTARLKESGSVDYCQVWVDGMLLTEHAEE